MIVWEVDIHPAAAEPDRAADGVVADAADLGFSRFSVRTARGYLLEGELSKHDVQEIAAKLLADPLVERTCIGSSPESLIKHPDGDYEHVVHVVFKAGVMDPVADSAARAARELGFDVQDVRTFRKYWFTGIDADGVRAICRRLLANDSIEETITGPLDLEPSQPGTPYRWHKVTVPICELDDAELRQLSLDRQLYLTLDEMRTIAAFFREQQREPTDIELETVAQTWSEHCSHKTLAGRIDYRDEQGSRHFESMLKETIFAATVAIRNRLGDDDFCVSVFRDNAGVVTFDDAYHAVFKVETHNHPSAIEPYGGANTGIGGVIRDTLGTGLGAKPVCNTDVFCFGPPDYDRTELPDGVLHPRRVMRGVVAGVRDYGNRMGIPTVNGALYFDERYLGNPLVYCGNVGILPCGKEFKEPRAGDLIVTIGGRTGRDGIHGATFSSTELSTESEMVSSGAVQIGNAIMEKMVTDVLLQARDRGLFRAVTDCGAGGYSSAVGEMGESIGAEVWLEQVPLKYEGLSYTEIWISEAQERMVLAVPAECWNELEALCRAEGVEATVMGRFEASGRLVLKYNDEVVGDLPMSFVHDGRPPVVREATYTPPKPEPWVPKARIDAAATLERILGSLNVCSKEWVIRQYDHEVQAGSVVKPLVGVAEDGPSDAAVVRPRLESRRGLVISCGMNPHLGDLDPYHMAACAIDEAIRNGVAVGADPDRIAILDNFCWGDTDRPETLGALVRAALGCHDTAVALGTPFISGKDSLNNEFRFEDASGERRSIAIPSTLLISALGQVDDVSKCVTLDFKKPGNAIFLVGSTRGRLGGSHLGIVWEATGGDVPQVDTAQARATFAAIHGAIESGLLRSCHDLSEGGLAAALAEMAFSGGFGADVKLDDIPHDVATGDRAFWASVLMFSETPSRFLCEVAPGDESAFEQLVAGVPHARIGRVADDDRLRIASGDASDPEVWIDTSIWQLKEAWQCPLRAC